MTNVADRHPRFVCAISLPFELRPRPTKYIHSVPQDECGRLTSVRLRIAGETLVWKFRQLQGRVRYLFPAREQGDPPTFCRWAAFPNQIRATLLWNRPKNVMDDGPTSVSLGTLAVRARYRRTDKRHACAKIALSVSVAKG